jgi:energy-converting hydrogenase Eha subunit F
MERALSLAGIQICGNRVMVVWNRHRVYPRPPQDVQSRVLEIKGPADKISGKALEEFLHTKIKFDLVERIEKLAAPSSSSRWYFNPFVVKVELPTSDSKR